MKSNFVILCILFATVANSFTTARAQVDVNDSLALVDLYNSTNGAEWDNNNNWLTGQPVSTWYGIGVTNTSVTSINLSFNRLSGILPSSIGNLANLTYLDLTFNHLSDSIPSSIGNLVNLWYLDLQENQLSSSIPSSIGNLVNLSILALYNNQLSGAIPSTIGNLVNLRVLELYNNQLSGSIPDALGNLVNLVSLKLNGNQLSGTIPSSIGNLLNLTYMGLNNNLLSGTIPSTIGNLVNLQVFTLYSNQLSGAIPASIGGLTNIQLLDLGRNQLSSVIPASIGNLVKLQFLELYFNQLSGRIPASIGNLVKLQELNLAFNQLVGSIPLSFKNLTAVSFFDVSNNLLSERKNVQFPLFKKQSVNANIGYNRNTFNGLEFIARKFTNVFYAVQDTILPVHRQGNTLSVNAGGTLSNNNYYWYKDVDLVATITGDSTYTPTQDGNYYVQVTNAIATQLTLYSDTIDFATGSLTANNRIAAETNNNKRKPSLRIYPNPAGSIVNIQANGTATITLTNSAGKIMQTKKINNNGGINVSSVANGTYYLQNKSTGEVKKIVVIH